MLRIVLASLLIVSCHGEITNDVSITGDEISDGANLLVTCNDDKSIIKALGYGNILIGDDNILQPQNLCPVLGVKKAIVIYKNAHFQTNWQKINDVTRKCEWQTAGAEKEQEDLQDIKLIRQIRIKAILNSEPKPLDDAF